MGIYTSDNIFGIRIYKFNDDDIGVTLFEEKYDEIMSHEQMREAYLSYDNLNDKNNIFFQFYTEYTSTLDINTYNFMGWESLPLNLFLKNFNV